MSTYNSIEMETMIDNKHSNQRGARSSLTIAICGVVAALAFVALNSFRNPGNEEVLARLQAHLEQPLARGIVPNAHLQSRFAKQNMVKRAKNDAQKVAVGTFAGILNRLFVFGNSERNSPRINYFLNPHGENKQKGEKMLVLRAGKLSPPANIFSQNF
jgi:hypothetical protein